MKNARDNDILTPFLSHNLAYGSAQENDALLGLCAPSSLLVCNRAPQHEARSGKIHTHKYISLGCTVSLG
jgi:hypothetical protein